MGLTLILSQAPTQNINASPLKTDLLNVQFIADDSIKTKTDTAMKYYIDGTEYISPKRTNICMGAIDQVEVLQSGTSAKYDGQFRELNQPTSPPATTERKNTFKRNKQR